VVDFVRKYLNGTLATAVLDPAAGFGGLLSAAQAATGATTAIGLDISKAAVEVGQTLNDSIDWRVGDSVRLLMSIDQQFEVVVGSLPFGIRQNTPVEIPLGDGSLEAIRGDIACQLLVLASLRLSENGVGVFVVPASFFWSQMSPFRSLDRMGLGVEAALSLPAGAFSPHHHLQAYIVVMRRKRFQQLLAGQLSNDLEANAKLIGNLQLGTSGQTWEHGRFVEAFNFVGIDAARVAEQFEAAETRFGAPAVYLIELSLGATFGRREADFRFPERGNAVYIPVTGEGHVLVSLDSAEQHLHRYVQVAIDPTKSDAAFVAQFFNSELGSAIRRASKRGMVHGRLTPDSLKTLRLFIPPTDAQRRMLAVDASITAEQNTLSGIQAELEDYRRRLWLDANRTQEVQAQVQMLSRRLAAGLRQQAEESLSNWRERLPFPLASILRAWDSVPPRDLRTKYEYLIHFFEASAQFLAIVALSAFKNNSTLFEARRKELVQILTESRLSLRVATFGAWNAALGYLSKQTRLLVNGNAEERALARELYADPQAVLPTALSQKAVLTVLEDANVKRNRWLGHRGAVGEQMAAQRHEQLVSCVQEFRKVTGGLWEHVELIEPVLCENLGDTFTNDVLLLTGSNARFEVVERSLLDCLVRRELYLLSANSERALRLLPLVRLGVSSEEHRDACYFFSRVDGDGPHFVSYHYAPIPDTLVQTKSVLETLSLFQLEE
jgi:hypothetical protein